MKKAIAKCIFFSFLVLFSGCSKNEELPPFHAKGKIIEVTGGCYLEIVLIEVENPQGIGLSGTFAYPGSEAITYKNAIGVPYFSKIGIPDTVPQTIGTRLYFEYRELTDVEKANNLYNPAVPQFCYANIIPPASAPFIITKIISYQ